MIIEWIEKEFAAASKKKGDLITGVVMHPAVMNNLKSETKVEWDEDAYDDDGPLVIRLSKPRGYRLAVAEHPEMPLHELIFAKIAASPPIAESAPFDGISDYFFKYDPSTTAGTSTTGTFTWPTWSTSSSTSIFDETTTTSSSTAVSGHAVEYDTTPIVLKLKHENDEFKKSLAMIEETLKAKPWPKPEARASYADTTRAWARAKEYLKRYGR